MLSLRVEVTDATALRAKIQSKIPPGIGITLNFSLYINPRQFSF
jgi:hypothetical protein